MISDERMLKYQAQFDLQRLLVTPQVFGDNTFLYLASTLFSLGCQHHPLNLEGACSYLEVA